MKYQVTVYYRASVSVVVDAPNEMEAVGEAYLEAGKKDYDAVLLNNVVVDDIYPEVEELDQTEPIIVKP